MEPEEEDFSALNDALEPATEQVEEQFEQEEAAPVEEQPAQEEAATTPEQEAALLRHDLNQLTKQLESIQTQQPAPVAQPAETPEPEPYLTEEEFIMAQSSPEGLASVIQKAQQRAVDEALVKFQAAFPAAVQLEVQKLHQVAIVENQLQKFADQHPALAGQKDRVEQIAREVAAIPGITIDQWLEKTAEESYRSLAIPKPIQQQPVQGGASLRGAGARVPTGNAPQGENISAEIAAMEQL